MSGGRGLLPACTPVRTPACTPAWALAFVLALAIAGAYAKPLAAQQVTPPAARQKADSAAQQQQQQQGQSPGQQAPKRRALEIRGQAPAPEVVTVRPREIPPYTRRIVSQLLADSGAVRRPNTAVVILPAAPIPTSPRPE